MVQRAIATRVASIMFGNFRNEDATSRITNQRTLSLFTLDSDVFSIKVL